MQKLICFIKSFILLSSQLNVLENENLLFCLLYRTFIQINYKLTCLTTLTRHYYISIFNLSLPYFLKMMQFVSRRFFSTIHLPQWATVNPYTLSGKHPHTVHNILDGKLQKSPVHHAVLDPMNGEHFINVSMAEGTQLQAYVQSQKKVPNFGLHNPIKNVHRYNMYGDIFFKISQQLRKPQIFDFFVKLTQRVMPKSTAQVAGQVLVTRRFFENFTGDNPRFFQQSFNVAGDHDGQTSSGYRWPYGNISIICPFNFPIQIPALQLYGALLTGNRPLLKCDTKMSVVMEQFLLMSHACGMPLQDVNFLNCSNSNMEHVIDNAKFKVIQFTGSSAVAEHLAKKTHGRVRIQDAGYDWKILGPDVSNLDYVAWVSDQDAYAASGQKCSAQSIIFVHQNWKKQGFLQKIKTLAARRKLQDLTVGPVLSWTNQKIKDHINKILAIQGSQLLFGGSELKHHTIPKCYGAFEPTAIRVPLKKFVQNFELCSQQLFGPFQIVVEYSGNQIDTVIDCCNRFSHHLTAGVVSNDVLFLDKVLGQTVNGVTYCGIRGRTTGAPQNHWFGPSGDPRGAGIGTKQAILLCYTTHREIIRDYGPLPQGWKIPPAS